MARKPTKSKKKKLSLTQWINEIGVDHICSELGVEPATVRNWRRRHCYPRVDQMREIRSLSGGRVSYEGIIDGVSR